VAFGQLLRVALAPSAVSDIFVGIAIGHAAGWPGDILPWLLIPASLGIYHGALALNDWVDRAEDARTRPERPIPSGAIPAPVALTVAVLLMLGGIMWAVAAGPRAGAWMAVVAALAVLYDIAGRGPWRGPFLLGLCRAGNLGAGLASPWLVGATDSLHVAVLPLAALYGVHVFFIGRLGRLEDDEDSGALAERPTRALQGAGWALVLIPIAAATALGPVTAEEGSGDLGATLGVNLGFLACCALALWSAFVLLRRARDGSREGWSRPAVGAATGLCLRRLPLLSAAIAATGAFVGPAAMAALVFALVGARLSAALRQTFPLT